MAIGPELTAPIITELRERRGWGALQAQALTGSGNSLRFADVPMAGGQCKMATRPDDVPNVRIPSSIPPTGTLAPLAETRGWTRWMASLDRHRSRRVCWLLIGLWIVNLFDLIMTVLAHQHRLLDESNPIAARILPLGPAMLMTYKIALVAIGTVGLYIFRHKFIAEFASGALLLIYVFVAIRWKNCVDVYETTCANLTDLIDRSPPPGWGFF